MALFGLGREVMHALLMHTGMYLILSEPYNCDMVRKRLPVYKNAVCIEQCLITLLHRISALRLNKSTMSVKYKYKASSVCE